MKHIKLYEEISAGANNFLKHKRIEEINKVDWPGNDGIDLDFPLTCYHGATNRMPDITLQNLEIERSMEDLLMKYGSSKLGCLGFYTTARKGNMLEVQQGFPKAASRYAIEKARKYADQAGPEKAIAQIYEIKLDPTAVITKYYPGGCLGRAFSSGHKRAENRLIELSDGFSGNGELAIINPDIITSIELIEQASFAEIENFYKSLGTSK